jgi:hypothetical protein
VLIVGGLWWTWDVLAAVAAGAEHVKVLYLIMGLAPALAGVLWLASDWFGL